MDLLDNDGCPSQQYWNYQAEKLEKYAFSVADLLSRGEAGLSIHHCNLKLLDKDFCLQM